MVDDIVWYECKVLYQEEWRHTYNRNNMQNTTDILMHMTT